MADTTPGPPRPSARLRALTGVWAVLAAVMSASLGRLMLPFLVLLIGVTLGVAWCSQLTRVLLDREARGRLTWRAMASWMVCPLTGLLFAALSFTSWPYMLRVKISEPALLRLVADLERGRADLRDPGRAGLIFVDHASVREDCVLLETETGFLTWHGLVYSRSGARPRPPPRTHVRHLYGRWYTFYESF